MNEAATVDFRQLGGVPVAVVVGEIDAANAGYVATEVFAGVGNHGPGLVIDLTGARYLDSAGVRLLFEVAERLRYRGQTLRIVASPESFVRDVLDAVRLGDEVGIDTGVTAAVDAVGGRA